MAVTSQKHRSGQGDYSPDLFDTPEDRLIILESCSLMDGIRRLNSCKSGFPLFCANVSGQITGVLSRGDVLRFLGKHADGKSDIAQFVLRDAMRPHPNVAVGSERMLFVRKRADESWYEQITRLRDDNSELWPRIKLLPVLDRNDRLVSILDLESPRTRARLEVLVMDAAFKLNVSIQDVTDTAVANRRRHFDSIHYISHWEKVRGLCGLLLEKINGDTQMSRDVFKRARADEIVNGLLRYEEWLSGHLSVGTLTTLEQQRLQSEIKKAKQELVDRYKAAANREEAWFPNAALPHPQIIIVLGCREDDELRGRVRAALELIIELENSAESPILIFSGGGDGQERSEAARMCDVTPSVLKELLKDSDQKSSLQLREEGSPFWDLKIGPRQVDILLEEDSLDTLGNAVFSWLTLKLNQEKVGLTSKSEEPRLRRLVLVTDGLHAPRSHDLFRRIFAFQNDGALYDGPEVAVKTVRRASTGVEPNERALQHLRSEAQAHSEIFRLVNPLTNGYDVIANGHVRSVLGQMIRLHTYYKNRWDLVRKYKGCWEDADHNRTTRPVLL